MDYLARREHSRHELLTKLKTRFPTADDEQITATIDWLSSQNLQSDQRFAEAWVRHRKLRGYGYLYLVQELRARGIPQPLIDQTLFEDDEDWPLLLADLLRRRLPETGRIAWGSKHHRRLHNYLLRRGFNAGLIQSAIKPHLSKRNTLRDES